MHWLDLDNEESLVNPTLPTISQRYTWATLLAANYVVPVHTLLRNYAQPSVGIPLLSACLKEGSYLLSSVYSLIWKALSERWDISMLE